MLTKCLGYLDAGFVFVRRPVLQVGHGRGSHSAQRPEFLVKMVLVLHVDSGHTFGHVFR